MIQHATEQTELHVYVEPEDGQYIAQCVEYDIIAVGDSPDDALESFIRVFIKHCVLAHSLGQSLSELAPPTDDVRQKWRTHSTTGNVRPFTIPRFTIRKRSDAEVEYPHFGSAAIAV